MLIQCCFYLILHQLNIFVNSIILIYILFLFFGGDKSPFCGATGALCFGLHLTPPMGFKARVDAPSAALHVAYNGSSESILIAQAGFKPRTSCM